MTAGIVLREYEAPGSIGLVNGGVYDDRTVYQTEGDALFTDVFQFAPRDGTILRTFGGPAVDPRPKDTTRDGRTLTMMGRTTEAHQIDPRDGTILRSVVVPPSARTIAYDGRTWFTLTPTPALAIQQRDVRTGAVLRSFNHVYADPECVDFDGRSFVLSDDAANVIAQLLGDGTTVRQFAAPAIGPHQIALDGRCFHHVDPSNGRGYQITLS